jgi:hypothetical protein
LIHIEFKNHKIYTSIIKLNHLSECLRMLSHAPAIATVTSAPDPVVISSLHHFARHIVMYPMLPFAVDFSFEQKDIEIYIDTVVASIIANKCQQMRLLDLSSSHVLPRMVEKLAAVLPLCPPHFVLLLSGNKISERGIQALIVVLRSGRCPEGLTLYLGDGNYDCHSVLKLLAVLPCAPKGFTLEVNVDIYEGIASDTSRQVILLGLAQVLQTGQCPPQLTIRLSELRHEAPVTIEPLTNALLHPACPKDLTLILNPDFVDTYNCKILLDTLRNPMLPHAFRLYFVNKDEYFPLPALTALECSVSLLRAKTVLVDKVSQHIAQQITFWPNNNLTAPSRPRSRTVPTTILYQDTHQDNRPRR